jgi:hypothetical protein
MFMILVGQLLTTYMYIIVSQPVVHGLIYASLQILFSSILYTFYDTWENCCFTASCSLLIYFLASEYFVKHCYFFSFSPSCGD